MGVESKERAKPDKGRDLELAICSFMIPRSLRDWVSGETMRTNRRHRGRLSDSAFVRDLVEAWGGEDMPVGAAPVPDDELVKVTWSLEKQQVRWLEEATTAWSVVGQKRVTKAEVMRRVLAVGREQE